jgi:hypothetical protein
MSIYPVVSNSNPIVLSPEDSQKIFEQQAQESRINEMLQYKNELTRDLKHFQKLKHKWIKLTKIFEYTGFGVLSSLGIATTILASLASAGIAIPLIVGIALGSGDTIGIIYQGIVHVLFESKKRHFRSKIKIVLAYINRSEYLIQRITEDKIITIEEIQAFRTFMDQYREEIDSIKETEIDIETIKKEIEDRTKKLQDELTSRYQSNVHASPNNHRVKKILERTSSMQT